MTGTEFSVGVRLRAFSGGVKSVEGGYQFVAKVCYCRELFHNTRPRLRSVAAHKDQT